MVSVIVAKLTSRIKGHHVYLHEHDIGLRFSCFLEPANVMSPGRKAIVVQKLHQEKKTKVGHVPEILA